MIGSFLNYQRNSAEYVVRDDGTIMAGPGNENEIPGAVLQGAGGNRLINKYTGDFINPHSRLAVS